MIDKKAVGARIRSIRLSMGYTQKEFVGIVVNNDKTAGHVHNWEAGYNLPNPKALSQIAFYGQISVDELLHGKRPDPLIEWIEKKLDETADSTEEGRYNEGYADAMLEVLSHIKLGGKDNE